MKPSAKKLAALLICLLLMPFAALAEGDAAGPTANGIVKAVHTLDITAPFSGTLLPFTLERGEMVASGQQLFALETQKIYAPESGKLTLFAAQGDLAEDVCRQYGMLANIEKANRFLLNCTTRTAYDEVENKFVSAGETLYFKVAEDTDIVGVGRVIAADPSGYTVEVAPKEGDNEYEIGKRVKLYRAEKKNSSSCVGEGYIARAAGQPVLGGGRILRCAASDGQTIKKGDLLFEAVASDAAPAAAAKVKAPSAGVVDAPKVVSGQQVYQGQVLATLHETGALKVVAEVDEVDLGRLHEGSGVSLVFDSFPDETVTGTVTHISQMGVAKQNATYYDVDITFRSVSEVRLFMNATVTLP